STAEVIQCKPYLQQEINDLPAHCTVLALGKIAHDAVLRSYSTPLSHHPFAHGAVHTMPDQRVLFDSYHCSRYNTQTRRLSPEMFRDVLQRAATASIR
ncbi:MAG: uracil-DNA glycosylase family protein, partial [Mariprofundaceae bacterium]|nr:uracil-DNA glycosylase family protein [Mariprofundaceae bacterium]